MRAVLWICFLAGIIAAATYYSQIVLAEEGKPSYGLHYADLQRDTVKLPDGTVGEWYSYQWIADGCGVKPYSLSISSGSLPPGLSLDAVTVVMSGIPEEAGTFEFALRLTDSQSPPCEVEENFILVISNPAVTLPEGTVGEWYSYQWIADGCSVKPYILSISSGSLPPGLSLDAVTVVMSGIPEEAGTFEFALRLTDSQSPPCEVEENFILVISNPAVPTVTPTGTPQVVATPTPRSSWPVEITIGKDALSGGRLLVTAVTQDPGQAFDVWVVAQSPGGRYYFFGMGNTVSGKARVYTAGVHRLPGRWSGVVVDLLIPPWIKAGTWKINAGLFPRAAVPRFGGSIGDICTVDVPVGG